MSPSPLTLLLDEELQEYFVVVTTVNNFQKCQGKPMRLQPMLALV